MRLHRLFIPIFALLLLAGVLPFQRVAAGALTSSYQQSSPPTPDEVINAVNALRLAYGLPPLNVHPVLMQVAQEQANGIASGLGGHWRPNNLTLGQWLISLGYPLSGDLTLDGYRSENWVAASTVDEAISAWLGDDPHTNTMLSQYRSDIGAGVAVGDDGIYIVLETALQTRTGQQQSEAVDFLTGIPMTQAVYSSGAAQSNGQSLLPEYIIPVVRSTARPDGDVFHTVQSGQTLWSIAVTYGTTIERLRAWNNLLGGDTILHPSQVLLVQRGATPPPPDTPMPGTPPTHSPIPSATPTLTPTAAPQPIFVGPPLDEKYSRIILAGLIFAVIAVAMGFRANAKQAGGKGRE